MTHHVDPTREQFLEILSAVSETIVMIDMNLTVQYVSSPEREGYRGEDVGGIPAVEFLPAEHRAAHRKRLLRVRETGEPSTFEIPILDAEGDTRWMEGTLSPMKREGRVVGIVSVSKDVTARRLAEEEAQMLRRLVPLCSWCGRIRSDEGYWEKIEVYVEKREGSLVTHGMCPDCEGRETA